MFKPSKLAPALGVLALFGFARAAQAVFQFPSQRHAQQIQSPRIRPPVDHVEPWQPELPSFGMRTFHNGYGEQIVRVRPGGVACQLGL